ncbi:hypothetical protein [Nocardia crassostreae]|uniref:hypothetical protein n=1 Tax=Nocardia crassostreae TaxID=53428 RepID=UPI0012F83B19|nr:hypothetical protein [Nocardia crassostreae]
MAAAVFALGAGILTGCGGGGGDDESAADAYCNAYKDLGGGSYVPNTYNSETLPKIRKVAEVAPAEIQKDWVRFGEIQEQLVADAGKPNFSPPADMADVAERIVNFTEKTCMK